MTNAEATYVVDALISASDLAGVTDNEAAAAKANELRENLRGYIIGALTSPWSGPYVAYRNGALELETTAGNNQSILGMRNIAVCKEAQ
jgi:hypothetical protein